MGNFVDFDRFLGLDAPSGMRERHGRLLPRDGLERVAIFGGSKSAGNGTLQVSSGWLTYVDRPLPRLGGGPAEGGGAHRAAGAPGRCQGAEGLTGGWSERKFRGRGARGGGLLVGKRPKLPRGL